MENLAKNAAKCANRAGFVKLWAATSGEVSSVTFSSATQRTVTFNSGGGWGKIEAKNIQLSDTENDNARNIEITCTFQGAPDQIDRRLHEMAHKRFIVKLKDRNGKLWLAGDKEQPLRFSYEHTGDADVAGLHQYALKFAATVSFPLFATV